MILDGRHRWRACEEGGVPPRTVTFSGTDAEKVSLIVSENLHRRHLTKGQRAMALAMIYPEPKRGEHADPSLLSKLGGSSITKGYLSQARTVLREDPELAKAVLAGTVSLSEAYQRVQTREADDDDDPEPVEELGDELLDDEPEREQPDDAASHRVLAEDRAPTKADIHRAMNGKHSLHVMGSSAGCEWYTPQHIFERTVTMLGGIDTDPCWHPESLIKASTTYTMDGLAHPWSGRVWLNPPYGRAIGLWVDKARPRARGGPRHRGARADPSAGRYRGFARSTRSRAASPMAGSSSRTQKIPRRSPSRSPTSGGTSSASPQSSAQSAESGRFGGPTPATNRIGGAASRHQRARTVQRMSRCPYDDAGSAPA